MFAIRMAGQDISFESMAQAPAGGDADIAQQDPNVADAPERSCMRRQLRAYFSRSMKPRAERKLSVDQIIAELRPKFAMVPGILVFLQNPPPITVSGQFSTSVYQMTLQSAESERDLRLGADSCAEDAHAARIPGCELRSADCEPAGDWWTSTAIAPLALGVIAATDSGRAVQRPTATARSPPSTRRPINMR